MSERASDAPPEDPAPEIDASVSLSDLRRQLREATHERERLERREAALRNAVQAVEALSQEGIIGLDSDESLHESRNEDVSQPDQQSGTPSADEGPGPQEPGNGPRGRDAVVAVLQDSPDTWMTVRNATQAVLARGWAPRSKDPESAVRAALGRAAKDLDEVERGHLDGRTLAFRWRQSPAPSGTEDSSSIELDEAEEVGLSEASLTPHEDRAEVSRMG